VEKILEILNQFPAGRVLALINIIGGPEAAEDLLAGRKTFRLEEAIRKLVDKHGRFIPLGLQSPVVDANYDYCLRQPKTDHKDRFIRMAEAFHCGSEISLADFIGRTDKVIGRIKSDAQLSSLLNGTFFRILLPRMEIKDHGKTMEEVFLPAVEAAYKKQFSGRNFVNYRKNELAGQVSIIAGTRYDKLVSAMAQGAVPAVYFPTALQGFSIPADREIIATLPEDIILSGGYDIAAAMVGYADVLARDSKTPVLDMAAWQWQSSDYSLNLGAGDYKLYFVGRSLGAGGDCAGGVLLLG